MSSADIEFGGPRSKDPQQSVARYLATGMEGNDVAGERSR
jgi:hypothetical protein